MQFTQWPRMQLSQRQRPQNRRRDRQEQPGAIVVQFWWSARHLPGPSAISINGQDKVEQVDMRPTGLDTSSSQSNAEEVRVERPARIIEALKRRIDVDIADGQLLSRTLLDRNLPDEVTQVGLHQSSQLNHPVFAEHVRVVLQIDLLQVAIAGVGLRERCEGPLHIEEPPGIAGR